MHTAELPETQLGTTYPLSTRHIRDIKQTINDQSDMANRSALRDTYQTMEPKLCTTDSMENFSFKDQNLHLPKVANASVSGNFKQTVQQ